MTSDDFIPLSLGVGRRGVGGGSFFAHQEEPFNQQQRASKGLEVVETVSQERVTEEEQAKSLTRILGKYSLWAVGVVSVGLGTWDPGHHRSKQGREARRDERWTWPFQTLLNLMPLNAMECLG